MRPSFIAASIGIFLTIISIIWFTNKWKGMSDFERLVTFILLCIFVAVNAIVYYVVDIYYEINPLIGKFNTLDEPIRRLRNIF